MKDQTPIHGYSGSMTAGGIIGEIPMWLAGTMTGGGFIGHTPIGGVFGDTPMHGVKG